MTLQFRQNVRSISKKTQVFIRQNVTDSNTHHDIKSLKISETKSLYGTHLSDFQDLPRQTLNTFRQTFFLRFHLGAESGHDGHGRVQGVAMHQTAVVADEREDAVEAARLEDRSGFACADQFKDLK